MKTFTFSFQLFSNFPRLYMISKFYLCKNPLEIWWLFERNNSKICPNMFQFPSPLVFSDWICWNLTIMVHPITSNCYLPALLYWVDTVKQGVRKVGKKGYTFYGERKWYDHSCLVTTWFCRVMETKMWCFISIKLELFSQRKSFGIKLKFPWMKYDAKYKNWVYLRTILLYLF